MLYMKEYDTNTNPVSALFITQSIMFSGAEINLISLLNTIDPKKIKPFLCINKESRIQTQKLKQSIPIFQLPLIVFKKINIFVILSSIVKLFWILVSNRIKIVYMNCGTGENFVKLFIPLFRIMKLPTIIHLHIHETDESLRWIKANQADRILFPSKATMNAVLTTSPWIKKEKCFFVHNGVDISYYRPISNKVSREELSIKNCFPIIGIVGQIKKIKGQHLFLEMAKKLYEQDVKANYIIIGKDTGLKKEFENHLKRMAKEFGIDNFVHFLGYRDDIPELMNLCDLIAIPSLKEPFGRVVIESMACGTPVVASFVDGIIEIFKDGNGGLFCMPNNAEDLALKAKQFFEDPVWWRNQKSLALKNARENFSQEKHTKEIEDHMLQFFNDVKIVK